MKFELYTNIFGKSYLVCRVVYVNGGTFANTASINGISCPLIKELLPKSGS